jgi:hypothetical protein
MLIMSTVIMTLDKVAPGTTMSAIRVMAFSA